VQGCPGFIEVIERPKHCGFRKRALGPRICCDGTRCPVRQPPTRRKWIGPV
jgi:hypothetical protein